MLGKETLKTAFMMLCLFAMLSCTAFCSGSALAQAGYSVSGTVEDCCGHKLAGIRVNLYDQHEQLDNSTLTDSNGFYQFDVTSRMNQLQDEGQTKGIFKLEFIDVNRRELRYVTEWYNDKFTFHDADRFLVTEAQPDVIKNIKLLAGGTIAGRVTDALGQGIAQVQVMAESLYGAVYYADTVDNGTYAVGGLPIAAYRVFFDGFYSEGNFAWEWFDDTASKSAAQTLLIASYGQGINGIDASLDASASISGSVTDPDGERMAGIGVRLYAADGPCDEPIDTDITKDNGTYTFDSLRPGKYKIYFDPQEGALQYAGEWYNNKNSFASADNVTVTPGQETALINAQMALSGSITGKAWSFWRRGIPATEVVVYDANAPAFGPEAAVILRMPAVTSDNGTYTITGLARGNYKLFFDAYAAGYNAEWFRNRKDFKAASKIVVTPGKTVRRINAMLDRGRIGFPYPGLGNCPAIMALDSNSQQLSILRHFRDDILSKTDTGQQYVDLYYTYGQEISRLLDSDKALKIQVATVLVAALPFLNKLLDGNTDVELPEHLVHAAQDVAEGIGAKAGADLHIALDSVIADLQDDAALRQMGFKKQVR
jgi:hypothetical protein